MSDDSWPIGVRVLWAISPRELGYYREYRGISTWSGTWVAFCPGRTTKGG